MNIPDWHDIEVSGYGLFDSLVIEHQAAGAGDDLLFILVAEPHNFEGVLAPRQAPLVVALGCPDGLL